MGELVCGMVGAMHKVTQFAGLRKTAELALACVFLALFRLEGWQSGPGGVVGTEWHL